MTVDNLYINGTSFATGWGKGYEDQKTVTPRNSWVTYFSQSTKPNKLYLDAIVGKGIGRTCRDTIAFCEKYKEKFGSLDNLNIILEFTTPRYRHWDPLKTINGDEAYPMAYISHGSLWETDHYFVKRDFNDNTLEFTDTIIPNDAIDPVQYDAWKKELHEWYFGGQGIPFYMVYASNEINPLKTYLSNNNAKYIMFWCVGATNVGRKLVDRYMRPLYSDGRLIATQQLSGHRIAKEESDECHQGHPDDKGHKFLADALENYINENRSFEI